MGSQSRKVFEDSCQLIPGGVNSPFRAFKEVGGQPPVLERGLGAYVWDVDGNRYLDFCCAWGPVILGHRHPALVESGHRALDSGAVLGSPTVGELTFAREICKAYPSMERVRLVNSGAEAVASALRVARGCTKRPRIMKFEGCYHGHVECLDSVGLEADELGGPLAMGASPGSCAETLTAELNNLQSVEDLLRAHPQEVAGIILEPITASMGVIVADRAFLDGLQRLCRSHGSLLIFDEVFTGSRVSRGGAQQYLRLTPDLTCLGKALGGGAAVGAYGGNAVYMSQVAPLGPIYQAGTFCGNPFTTQTGIANLQELERPGAYQQLEYLTGYLIESLHTLSPDLIVQGVTGMLSIGFGTGNLKNHRDVKRLDTERFSRVYHRLLEAGFYLPPSTLDAACLSMAHTREDIDAFLRAFKLALT